MKSRKAFEMNLSLAAATIRSWSGGGERTSRRAKVQLETRITINSGVEQDLICCTQLNWGCIHPGSCSLQTLIESSSRLEKFCEFSKLFSLQRLDTSPPSDESSLEMRIRLLEGFLSENFFLFSLHLLTYFCHLQNSNSSIEFLLAFRSRKREASTTTKATMSSLKR